MIVPAKSIQVGDVIFDPSIYEGQPIEVVQVDPPARAFGKPNMVRIYGEWLLGHGRGTSHPQTFLKADKKIRINRSPRRNPKMSDPDESLVMDVWLEGLDGKWHHEATCTLAEFFAENPTARSLSKHDMRAELFMRGQWVHRKSNPAWKISFHK